MSFIKYNSIENATNKMILDFLESPLHDANDEWCVMEKVHGSNFSIIGDKNGNLIPAKRTDTLSMTSNFFNFQRVFDKYETGLKELVNDVYKLETTIGEPVTKVQIFGELCGGDYPNMPQIPNAKKVQKEVSYSNDTEFIVYDIRMFTCDNKYFFVDYDVVVELCNKHNIHVIPIIYRGNFRDCLRWSNEHNEDPSEIWKIFGMPFEAEDNIREGNVLKPVHKTIFKGDHRIIFKDKNEKFKERKSTKKPKEVVQYSDALYNVLGIAESMICVNRFNSVVSKYGDYTIRDFGNLMNEMVRDILDELFREGADSGLSYVDKNELHKLLIKKVSGWMGRSKKELF